MDYLTETSTKKTDESRRPRGRQDPLVDAYGKNSWKYKVPTNAEMKDMMKIAGHSEPHWTSNVLVRPLNFVVNGMFWFIGKLAGR